MNKFKNWLEKHDRVFCKSGYGIVDVMAPVTDEDGKITLVIAGKHNLYAEIQSHADSVDIHNILQRYRNGDISALNKRSGAYMDLSDMPSNYSDIMNMISESRVFFDGLKPEIKEKFDNDFSVFLESVGSMRFIDAFKVDDDVPNDEKDVEKDE